MTSMWARQIKAPYYIIIVLYWKNSMMINAIIFHVLDKILLLLSCLIFSFWIFHVIYLSINSPYKATAKPSSCSHAGTCCKDFALCDIFILYYKEIKIAQVSLRTLAKIVYSKYILNKVLNCKFLIKTTAAHSSTCGQEQHC